MKKLHVPSEMSAAPCTNKLLELDVSFPLSFLGLTLEKEIELNGHCWQSHLAATRRDVYVRSIKSIG